MSGQRRGGVVDEEMGLIPPRRCASLMTGQAAVEENHVKGMPFFGFVGVSFRTPGGGGGVGHLRPYTSTRKGHLSCFAHRCIGFTGPTLQVERMCEEFRDARQ